VQKVLFKGGLGGQTLAALKKYHTATQSDVHAALRKVLGDYVTQHGKVILLKNVCGSDFNHDEKNDTLNKLQKLKKRSLTC